MRVVIDRSVCLKSGQCFYMQPDIFEGDAEGGPVIRVERPEDEQLDKAREAIEMCPSQAIRLEET